MTPEIYRFIASPLGEWMEIPGTWLEANPGGQVRDQRTGKWFGDVRYQDHFPYLLAGVLPVWNPHVVRATTEPAPYFFRRSIDDENPDRERADLADRDDPYKPVKPVMPPEPVKRGRPYKKAVRLGPDLFENYTLEKINA